MRAWVFGAFFAIVSLTGAASVSSAFELNSRYTTIVYEREELLRRFNNDIPLGSLAYLLRNKKAITANDEIANKVDVIIERIEVILDMFPKQLKFRIVLLPGDSEVRQVYRNKYGLTVDYIAFYSPKEKTVYVSVNDLRLGVLAHELTHVILDHYFTVPPPEKVHEVLAQFVETHLKE